MIIRARAPMRLDLAGGWTDVEPYAADHGGAVVNVAIGLYARASVERGGRGIRLHAQDLGAVVTARRADDLRADGELGLLKAAARRYGPSGAFDLTTRTDAPPGAGLGGSGALGVALVAALTAATDTRRLPAEVAGAAFDLERVDAGVMGGRQDQYAAALGGLLFLSFGEPEVTATRLAVSVDCSRELEQHLVLCHTGASHVSDVTHRSVWDRYGRGEAAVVRALDGLRACALEMRRALLGGDLARAADVMNENWRLQRALGEGMQTADMARMEAAAREAGGAGAKACGAGAGGCLLVLARPGAENDVAGALRAEGGHILPVTFDTTGVVTWSAAPR